MAEQTQQVSSTAPTIAPAAAPDQLLTAEDVAQWLGVATFTLYQWRRLGKPPAFVRVGRRVRYRRADVEAWIEAQKVGGKAQ